MNCGKQKRNTELTVVSKQEMTRTMVEMERSILIQSVILEEDTGLIN